MQNKQPEIGIFWLYKSSVIAKSISVTLLSADSLGIIDCGYSHFVEWEQHLVYLPMFPELAGCEYQEIARGRIIYCKADDTYKVYADKKIKLNTGYRALITERFGLNHANLKWLKDPHYRVFSG
ncbi:hypothetical protein N7931_01535 [Catenovulum sp. 2E275]|uniref:hypothetical protein n=1 Tax=Catenovulum sp. 2E275 TaxID=2980497 RepID=UPI0021D262D3|nr:hypothetical protein [Catenovulum sp. 2E275]MCU4674301.1 hypothetical protein [Catenovulum sp. 2E275]